MKKRIISMFLAFTMALTLLPGTALGADAAIEESTGQSGDGSVTITQTANWSSQITGRANADVTITVNTTKNLQKAKDVVLVMDRSALQNLNQERSDLSEFVNILKGKDGTRFALVTYHTTASTLQDFTADAEAVTGKAETVELGYNSNFYAALLEAEALIDSREDTANEACIVLFSNGGFNMNPEKMRTKAAELRGKGVTIVGASNTNATGQLSTVCSTWGNTLTAALTLGESQYYSSPEISGKLNAGSFRLTGKTSGVEYNAVTGEFSYTPANLQMGRSVSISFSVELKDRGAKGVLPLTSGDTVFREGGAELAKAGNVSLDRRGYSVTYAANGGSGTLPADNNLYALGDTVALKSGDTLNKPGQNFSGWVSSNPGDIIEDGRFQISGNTTLNAAWGRAYVRMGTNSVNVELPDTTMKPRNGWNSTENYYAYKNEIKTIEFHNYIPALDEIGATHQWNVGTEDDGSAVKAWLTLNEEDRSMYDLHIGAVGKVVAPKYCRYFFQGFSALQSISGLKYLDTSNVTNMSGMFYDCTNLTNLNLSSFNTSKVTHMTYMFYGCTNLTNLNLSSFDTSKVTSMDGMFWNCDNLTNLDLSNFDTLKVTSMDSMFCGCRKLTSLDLSTFDTSKVTNMTDMFAGCSELASLDLSNFNTSKETSMSYMFYECYNLRSLDLSSFDTSNVTDMHAMFTDCSNLTSLDLSSFDTSNVTDMSWMFVRCSNLTSLDLSNFDTSNVTDMHLMFTDCSNLTSLILGMDDDGEPIKELTVAAGCIITSWRLRAENLEEIKILAKDENGGYKLIWPESTTAAASIEPAEYTEDPEADWEISTASLMPEEGPELPDEEPLPVPQEDTSQKTDRPIYASEKKGVWDCGQLTAGQAVEYALEVQYLGDPGGVSGELLVTNPIPEGLTVYPDTISIEGPLNIETSAVTPKGSVKVEPSVKDNVLTFSVTGLSAGAKFVVTYRCLAPMKEPDAYTEFLNTASVDDNGLIDNADPIRYYMNAKPADMYTVDFNYSDDIPGAPGYAQMTYEQGTVISLPVPSVPGYTFNGWIVGGEPVDSNNYEITGNTVFTGSWTEIPKPNDITINYAFEGDLPENHEAILNHLLDGVTTQLPAGTKTTAPILAVIPEGYDFAWQSPVGSDGSFTVGDADMTVSGSWTKKSFTVTYVNGGETEQAGSYQWGSEITVRESPANTDTQIFLGWSGAGISEGKFIMPMEDVTLTAVWLDREVQIDPNGGKWRGSAGQQTIPAKDYVKDSLEDPTDGPGPFQGWAEQEDPDGILSKIVTAQWGDRPAEHTHAYTETVTPPTCTGDGYTTHTCSVCGDSYTDNETKALGHDYRLVPEESVPAAPGQDGYDYYRCSRCGADRKVKTDAAVITHKATFTANGTVVDVVTFEEGAKTLREPAVPELANHIGEWPEYDLASKTEDFTVEAVYTPTEKVETSEPKSETEIKYDNSTATITLRAEAETKAINVFTGKPLDVVLVLDQSGSMADPFSKSNGKVSKKDTLVACANQFIQSLYESAVQTGADHRVALAGFACSDYIGSSDEKYRGGYLNTGLLTSESGKAVNYRDLTPSVYKTALLPIAGNGGINEKLLSGIRNIKADGATAADLGLEMAKNIFSWNTTNGQRQRVVIFITDGTPTSWLATNAAQVNETARNAIVRAGQLKKYQGVSVYCIGVQSEADQNSGIIDFNRFLHAVSSNYPNSAGMDDLGNGSQDSGYYVTVSDTAGMEKAFNTLFSVTACPPKAFDKVTFHYTLPETFILTLEQELSMRKDLCEEFGISNADILISRNPDGTTAFVFRNIPTRKAADDNGVSVYRAELNFQVSVNRSASGSVSGGEGSVECGGGSILDLSAQVVNIPSDRKLIVFEINGEIYKITEAELGDRITVPESELAKWKVDPGATVTDDYVVFNAELDTDTTYSIEWTMGEVKLTDRYRVGERVIPPDATGNAPEGLEFTGWSGTVPTVMPAYDLSCTAIYSPAHEHNFVEDGREGDCDTGNITYFRCVCGKEKKEVSEPAPHQFMAMLASSTNNGNMVEQLCCTRCGYAKDMNITFKVAAKTSIWQTKVLDLSLYEREVGITEPGKPIELRIYIGTNYKQSNISVTRIDPDGTSVKYPFKLQNGWLIFEADHFSIYVIGELNDEGNPVEDITYEDAVSILDGIPGADHTGSSGGSSSPSKPSIRPAGPDNPPTNPATAVREFSDVTTGDWFYGAVMYAVQNGLFTGTSATTFSPNDAMTRAMMMTVLARQAGTDTKGSKPWYAKGMTWAMENGISDGSDPTGFITREQFAAMLYRYAGSPAVTGTLERFHDKDQVSAYAADAITWAVEHDIIRGKSKGLLAPKSYATRAEAAAMLMRYLEGHLELQQAA